MKYRMKINTAILASWMAVVCSMTAFAAGQSFASPASLSIGKTVTGKLVGEDGDPDGAAVYYYKIIIKKGQECTLILSSSAGVTLDSVDAVMNSDTEYDYPWFSNSEPDTYSPEITRSILSADDWDFENWTYPDYITYIVSISGYQIGDSFTISSSASVVEESIPPGVDEEHAAYISPSTSIKSSTVTLFDSGSYYFKAPLKANTKYYFGTLNGDTNSVEINVYPTVESSLPQPVVTLITNDTTGTWADLTHGGVKVVPTVTGTYIIEVSSATAETVKLSYKQVGERLPANHAATLLAPTLDGIVADIAPGSRNDPNSGYYDSVIDHELFKVDAKIGVRYLFWISNPSVQTNYVMEIYDSKGNVLGQSVIGDCDHIYGGPMLAFSAPANATYWIGVCQAIEDEDAEMPVDGVTATLNAKIVTVPEDGFLDDADKTVDDPNDDETALSPVIGDDFDDPVSVDIQGTGIRHFSYTDWLDTYRIDARKGVSYNIVLQPRSAEAALLDGETETISSDCFVFSGSLYAGSSRTAMLTSGDMTTGLVFTATANQSYYLRVSKNAQGTLAAYTLHSVAYSEGGVGALTVNLFGPVAGAATWTLNTETSPKYVTGATIIIPSGPVSVKFSYANGWATPAVVTGNLETNGFLVLEGNYNDLFDPRDDVFSGATAIVPAAAVLNSKTDNGDGTFSVDFRGGLLSARSLWSGDTADWFKFTVSADSQYWYAAELVTVTNKAAGSGLALSLYDATATNELSMADGEFYLPKGTYYLKVASANSDAFDGTYTLRVGLLDYGGVKLDKATYSFAENAANAVVKVKRTGTAAISCWFTTVAGTAVPGVDYKPVTTTLSWNANDKTDKTINIPLIPDLYPVWETNKTFTVELRPIVSNDGTTNVYPYIAAPASADITLKEVSRQIPGTLGFSAYADDARPFANIKTPAMTVVRGDRGIAWIERTVGSNGRVGVKVETVVGTAVAGTDFEMASTNLYWEADEMDAKAFVFNTLLPDGASYQDKTMTLRMTVDSMAGARASAGVSSVAVTIRNSAVGKFLEEDAALAKTLNGTKGVWYFDGSGNFACAPLARGKSETLTYTVAGPGRFVAMPSFFGNSEEGDKFTCTIGREVIDCTEGDEIVRYLGKGNQSVKFTVTRGFASSSDVYVMFTTYPVEDGGEKIFDWMPLSAPTVDSPADKAVVEPDVSLMWADDPTGTCAAGYYVSVDSDKRKLGTTNSIYFAEVTGTEVTPDAVFEAGKTYSWRVDAYVTDDEGNVVLVNTNSAAWTFTVAATNVVVPVFTDQEGNALDLADGMTIVQGCAYTLGMSNKTAVAGVTYKVLAGKLPDGIKLAQDLATKAWTLSGTATKVGTYTAIIQAINGRTPGQTAQVTVTVEPAYLAEGTFNGILSANGTEGFVSTNANEKAASIAFTATAAGKLTAKVAIGTKSYTFSGTGYDGSFMTNGMEYVYARLTSQTKLGLRVYTNVLDVTVFRGDGDTNNFWLAQLASPSLVSLDMTIPTLDNKGVQEKLAFTGEAYRMNAKESLYLAAIAPAVGYYTVSLPVVDSGENIPQGAGYLTVTIDAKGSAKLSGKLGDGSTVSLSAQAVCMLGNDFSDQGVFIPVFTAKNKMMFAGVLELVSGNVGRLDLDQDTEAFVVPADAENLFWANGDAASTYAGTNGFAVELAPVGGFYDKLFNLQRFYLNRNLTVGDVAESGYPDELFTQYGSAYTNLLVTPSDLALTLVGDTMTVTKRKLVKNAANSKLNDLAASENASNLTVQYTRATGIFNGGFSLWLGDNVLGEETLQKEVTAKYEGVLTPYKAMDGRYEDVPGLGFFTLPVKIGLRTWTGSWLFQIQADDISAANGALWSGEGLFTEE